MTGCRELEAGLGPRTSTSQSSWTKYTANQTFAEPRLLQIVFSNLKLLANLSFLLSGSDNVLLEEEEEDVEVEEEEDEVEEVEEEDSGDAWWPRGVAVHGTTPSAAWFCLCCLCCCSMLCDTFL